MLRVNNGEIWDRRGGAKRDHSVLGACPRSTQEARRGVPFTRLTRRSAWGGLWTNRGQAGSGQPRPVLTAAALVEPIALAIHLEDMDVVG